MTAHRRRLTILGALTVFLVLGISAVIHYTHQPDTTIQPSIVGSLSECVSGSLRASIGRSCVSETVAILLNSYPPSEIIRSISTVSTPPDLYATCHAVAHEVGKQLYEREEDLEKTLALCTQNCGDGCTHGAVASAVLTELGDTYADEDLSHLDTTEILRVGEKYCMKSAALCHGIGHLLFMSSRDYGVSVSGCETIAGEWSEKCYRGVFMEGVGGQDALVASVDAAIPVSERSYGFPCNTMPARAQHACFSYLPRYQNDIFEHARIVDANERLSVRIDVCEALSGRSRSECFEGIGYSTLTRETPREDVEAQKGMCTSMKQKSDRLSCTLGEISGYIWYYRFAEGLTYCEAIPERDVRSLCYRGGFYTMQEEPIWSSNDDVRAVCDRLGVSECGQQFDTYLRIKKTLPEYQYGLYGTVR